MNDRCWPISDLYDRQLSVKSGHRQATNLYHSL